MTESTVNELIAKLRDRAESDEMAASEIDPLHYTPDEPGSIAAGLEFLAIERRECADMLEQQAAIIAEQGRKIADYIAELEARSAPAAGASEGQAELTAEDVSRQYQDGVHIGSGLPRATCPCGFCARHRYGFNLGDSPKLTALRERIAGMEKDAARYRHLRARAVQLGDFGSEAAYDAHMDKFAIAKQDKEQS